MALVSSSMVTISMDDGLDLDLSGCSTTTTTTTTTATTTTTTSNTDHQHGCTWNDWSPVVDWDAFTGGHDDFRDLIESMMDEDGVKLDTSREIDQEGCNSNSTASTADAMIVDEETNGSDEDTKGLRLVHLLMAAAEALTGANKSRDLARVIFVRLKELSSPTDGSNMERLAAYFTDALQGLLEGARDTVHGKHFISNGPHHRDDYHHHHHHHQTEVIAAFQLLQDMSPYVKFGHFTANQAILEAVVHDRRVHIVDYDIMEGIQWASLMQALVSKKDGPPAPHLRITALTRGNGGRRQIGTIQETGRRLVAFAASIGQPFSFHQCRMDSDETFTPSALKLVKGETLIFNCMLNLPHFSYRSPESIASFLSGAKTLSPRLMTLVEEEVMTVGDGGFVARFIDSLYHYSAVYDSLEAGCPTQTRSRALVERVFIGPRIAGSLGRIYRADKDEMCSWGNWLVSMGSKAMQISNTNRVQAKLLLGLFNDGYRVEELANNRLVLGWKSRRLLSASVWTS